jgi:hypothetical protein
MQMRSCANPRFIAHDTASANIRIVTNHSPRRNHDASADSDPLAEDNASLDYRRRMDDSLWNCAGTMPLQQP